MTAGSRGKAKKRKAGMKMGDNDTRKRGGSGNEKEKRSENGRMKLRRGITLTETVKRKSGSEDKIKSEWLSVRNE